MFWVLIAVHVILCGLLVLLVLVQNDKGGGLGSLAGGMGGGAAFTSAGAATFIQKLTRWVAILFMGVVLALNLMVTNTNKTDEGSELQKAAETGGLGTVLPVQNEVETAPIKVDTSIKK